VIKKILILSISMCIVSLNIMAKSDIVLTDDSNNANIVQKDIVGCEENSTPKQQKKDIAEIKSQLTDILKKLSAMEQETDSNIRNKQISNIKDCITKLDKKTKKYIIVKVKSGDRLSDYAKKYYGSKRKYYRIYRANRDKIKRDLQLRVGDRIIIPLSKNYKYKKFKKRHRAKHRRVTPRPQIVEQKREIIIEEPKIEYAVAKYISNSSEDSTVKMLDEVVYIDDDNRPTDNSGFIPLDEN